jgi:hypothetical protein
MINQRLHDIGLTIPTGLEKNSKKCKTDITTTNIKIVDKLDTVSFAPFLMWNVHDDKYFEEVGAINTAAINDNNVYDTQHSCNIDDNYSDLMKETFFSLENMDIIQNKIIEVVFYSSEKKLRVNKIKSETLIQVMNHMWTNFCRFLPYKLKEQIYDLNMKVVEYVVPLLLKEYTFYLNYLRDSDRASLPPLERPIFVSNSRTQQNPSFYK